MKTVLVVLAGLLGCGLSAAEVTLDQARRAVGRWLASGSAFGSRLGASVADARTCLPTNGVAYHVVRLAGGGFVVTSGDTTCEPVVAFSEGTDLVEDDANPLWAILTRDALARQSAASGAVQLMSAAPLPGAGEKSPAEKKWEKLLGGVALQSASSVSDVRVAPFVQSKWNQLTHNNYTGGKTCYNYYTPNNYYCGCVATAGAQIMRYFEWPKTTDSVSTFTCSDCCVNGKKTALTTQGGTFDWSRMPLDPNTSSLTEAQRQAIGKLTSDIGIICAMEYASTGSAAGGYMLAFAFSQFRYSNCMTYAVSSDTSGSADMKNALLSNFDARLPVLVSIRGASNGHAVVGDGYGYSDESLYIHLNMGWGGANDAWYCPPDLNAGPYQFNVLDGFDYNIYTNQAADSVIISGRVTDAGGAPVAGATVTASRSGASVSARTDGQGVYALFVAAPTTVGAAYSYSVTAVQGAASVSRSCSVKRCVTMNLCPISSGYYGLYWTGTTPSVGNRWGQDLVLTGLAGVEAPVFTPESCIFYPSTNVTLSCATAGATIRYTLDGTEPTASSSAYSGPITVTEDTTIKARAFRTGMNPSAVITADYAYDVTQEAPEGDYFANPLVRNSLEGSYTAADISRYSLEDEEPLHTLEDYSYYFQYQSIWLAWTAPASGSVTFTTQCTKTTGSSTSLSPTAVAVYEGESFSTLTRVAMSKDYESSDDYTTRVTLDVERGLTYRVAGVTLDGSVSGYAFVLSWSLTPSLEPATETDPADTTVAVPYAWLREKLPDACSAGMADDDYTALALEDTDGDGYSNWQEYLCGTDPLVAWNRPQCFISVADGTPVVTHSVDIPSAAADAGWTAQVMGCASLTGNWSPAGPDVTAFRFFKVVVRQTTR